MSAAAVFLVLASCAVFMIGVAYLSYRSARTEVGTSDGYFLAGRNLGGLFIAGSLLLTNLSAEQLIGLNGSAYGYNMSSMAWEVTAAISTIAMAMIFLPRYLKGAFTTLPEFLNNRYDPDVRRLSVMLFMLGYGLVTIPSVLYSGSIAVIKIFDVPTLLGLSEFGGLVATVLLIGGVGALYAVFGGLKAVAVSDTINGLGLLIVGILVLCLGLNALGNGDMGEGVSRLLTDHPEKLNAIGDQDAPTPFGTLFTGMLIANLFYWCTNQYVIQRTLAARSLAEGQKGVLLSGFFKLLVPIFMMIPGVIAYHLYGPSLSSIDLAFPTLVQDLLPIWLMGFFLAVLLGAVFSSFNSLINSAATLFVLDIYAPSRKVPMSDRQTVRVAMIASVVIAVMSFAIAPLLYLAPQGLWQIIRIFTGFYNIPIVTIVLFALFAKNPSAIGAKLVIGFHIIAYGLLKFVFDDIVTLHFLHLYALLFLAESLIMIAAMKISRKALNSDHRAETTPGPLVDLTPWKHAVSVSLMLAGGVILIYVLFSPLGIATY
ncbi:MAG: solute:sodium symporter family transporter [Litorimonas sp.]